ncbi:MULTISPECIES: porin [Achromobacter]|uniref:Porin n=1 Tax=Achromobacter denitrificans TaxID=32002 RepID=A0A427WJN4_ACHDE|nr:MULTISPECIES: porin [Achromobacter]QKQ47648.1 porin [Achromobacter denitrificans]RSE77645.1 porin [Achromobacter denitrificans]CAB3850753.1 Outer membrane porin protein 32 [Achromobacter denitrificans]
MTILTRIGLLGACTVAVPAYAQSSSLAIFGHIDVNVTAASAGGSSKVGLDQGGYMLPSRIGLRGTESLGNGNSVGFWLEAPILPNSGGPQGLTWSRRSTISLANERYGELRLGRDYTAAFWNVSSFSPFGTVGVGGSSNIIKGWPLGLDDATTLSRASNMLAYFLPKKLGGVYGQLNYAREEDMDGADYAGGRLGYQSGPLNVAAAYGRTSMGGGEHYETTTVGGSYDFRALKLFANYLLQEVGPDRQHVALAGAAIPVGKGHLKLSYSRSTQSGTHDGDNAQQFAVGYTYALSKRTVLYTAASFIKNDGNAAFVTGDVAPEGVPGENSKGFQVGISHSF